MNPVIGKTSEKVKVGVVGLGTMGGNIALNLIDQGYEVYGYDLDSLKINALCQHGGFGCSDLATLGKTVNTVIVMVFSPSNLKDVILGENALADNLMPGGTVLITGSMGPDIVDEIEPKLTKKHIDILDTPVLAGFQQARAGTMKMLVAGKKEVVERNINLIKAMSAKQYYIGSKAGMAQAGKMCIQTMMCISWQTAAELLSIGDRYGLDKEEMSRLYHDSPSFCTTFAAGENAIRNSQFSGTGERLAILNKDIHLFADMIDKTRLTMPVSKATADFYQQTNDMFPDEDVFASFKLVNADGQE